jgi:hypothetical protein
MTRLLFLVLIILSPPAFAVDVSTSQVDMLPKALTDIKVHTGKFGKPSAGDVIELSVRAPLGEESAAPAQAEKLKDQPIEWGNGRLLWWKPADSNGVISLGAHDLHSRII